MPFVFTPKGLHNKARGKPRSGATPGAGSHHPWAESHHWYLPRRGYTTCILSPFQGWRQDASAPGVALLRSLPLAALCYPFGVNTGDGSSSSYDEILPCVKRPRFPPSEPAQQLAPPAATILTTDMNDL